MLVTQRVVLTRGLLFDDDVLTDDDIPTHRDVVLETLKLEEGVSDGAVARQHALTHIGRARQSLHFLLRSSPSAGGVPAWEVLDVEKVASELYDAVARNRNATVTLYTESAVGDYVDVDLSNADIRIGKGLKTIEEELAPRRGAAAAAGEGEPAAAAAAPGA
jgi:hypothetical protein